MARKILLVISALCLLRGGCTDRCACTAMFAMQTLTVIDGQGTPLDSMDISVWNTLTRQLYDMSVYNEPLPVAGGRYVVFHDGLKGEIHGGGEDIAVEVRRDTTAYDTVEFVFGVDACDCHVRKLAGPDTLVIPAL